MLLGNRQVIELSRALTLLPHLDCEAIKFFMRLCNVLFVDPLTKVSAVWTLFNRLSEYAGAELSQQLLLPSLVRLYDVDEPCTEKMLKVNIFQLMNRRNLIDF